MAMLLLLMMMMMMLITLMLVLSAFSSVSLRPFVERVFSPVGCSQLLCKSYTSGLLRDAAASTDATRMSVCLSVRASVKPTQPVSECPTVSSPSPPSGTRELSANVNFSCCNRGAQADVCSSAATSASLHLPSVHHLGSLSASLLLVLLC